MLSNLKFLPDLTVLSSVPNEEPLSEKGLGALKKLRVIILLFFFIKNKENTG